MIKVISKTRFILPLLAFSHGAVLTILFVLFAMSNYEDKLYDQLVSKLTKPGMSQQDYVLSLLSGTHDLLKPRQDLFGDSDYIGIRDNFFRSSDIQLIDAKGNCGSYSHVLGRLLQRAGFEVRIVQMKCGDTWGCHILLEAKVEGRFVSLAPLYNLAFVRPDGKLASFQEVGQGWVNYKTQAPENYNNWYAYEGARYTNWTKIPFLMPAAKYVLEMLLGDQVETLSLRSWVLNVYKTWLIIFVLGYSILLLLSLYIMFSRTKN